MNAKWLLQTLYEIGEVKEDSEHCFSCIETDTGKPLVLNRLTSIEKQIPHPSYVFANVHNLHAGIETFIYVDGKWRYLDLFYKEEKETIQFFEAVVQEGRLKELELSKSKLFEPFRNLMYTYFVTQPAYRLKEATGLIRRKD